MLCPYCNEQAEWTSNDRIYGKRYGKSWMVWLCVPCGAYVGCHRNTQAPLGTMANKELRRLRMDAHAHIDPLWKEGGYKRSAVYWGLDQMFGKIIHVGESDVDLAKAIARVDLVRLMAIIDARPPKPTK